MPFCIDYQRVAKKYGDQQILQGLSLALEADVTTAIVGASGSGKSTLLQIGNGLIVPEQGQVKIFDKELTTASSQQMRLGIGYSQQGAGLFPHLTIYDNATLMARLQHWPQAKIDERYRKLMQLLGLSTEFDQRYPFSLSGGQQQRVSLCRAMMLDPPLLLLDEPFSALDPVTRESIHTEFLQLQQVEQRSIVLVTHDMSEALKLANRIVVLRKGRVEQHASVEEVQANPASDYVTTLFAAGTES